MRLAGGMEECNAAERAIPAQVLSHNGSENGTSTMPTKHDAVFPVPVELEIAQGGRPLRVAYPSPWRPVVVTSRSRNRRSCRKTHRRAHHVPVPWVHE